MLLSCDLVDDEELPLAGLAVVLIFSNTSLDPLLFTLGTTFFVLAVSGHVRTSAGQALPYLDE